MTVKHTKTRARFDRILVKNDYKLDKLDKIGRNNADSDA